MSGLITAYLKPTNYCNVDCSHCYLPIETRQNKSKMSMEMIDESCSLLSNFVNKANKDGLFLIWHGGEPLVLSPDYFWECSPILDKYFKDIELIESVQTSLIPYRSEFAPIVKTRWGGFIGSSIDFNSRLVKGSVEDYHKLWMSKVELARSDDILIIPTMVPSKTDCYNSKYIYNWFKERDFLYWGLDRYSDFDSSLPNVPTNREHSNFLIGLFDSIIEDIHNSGSAVHIRTIAAGIGGVLFNMPGDRWGSTCQSDFIVINPDGSLNSCPDRSSFEKSFGRLSEGYKSFEDSPMRKKWIRIQQAGHRISDCYSCENSEWCKSGCPITGNACIIDGIRDECSGFKSFITHVRNFANQSEENREILTRYINREFTFSNHEINENLIGSSN